MKLVEQFGTQLIDDALLERFERRPGYPEASQRDRP